ncbi:MAG TPA: hypothetical protein DER09_13385 [Prolixibacteraceae bacterium]|nr:hypothetical protein [Prolixibacteraceae bacterium]
MESASLSDIRNEIKNLSPADLQAIVLRLAKFKKENKELVSYLLYEANDEITFIQNCKNELDVVFSLINKHSHLYVKKSLRKATRIVSQYIKFAGTAKVEIELLIYFCQKMKADGFHRYHNTVIRNIYLRQRTKIEKVLQSLHEDLQYDYQEALEEL